MRTIRAAADFQWASELRIFLQTCREKKIPVVVPTVSVGVALTPIPWVYQGSRNLLALIDARIAEYGRVFRIPFYQPIGLLIREQDATVIRLMFPKVQLSWRVFVQQAIYGRPEENLDC